ncbi:MAG: FtsX-like permease family protein [Candidatus Moranbacteria bacterium]|nr:FtsX-like permease family protein [Candidatus Moranbacteria bacterium]
MRFLISIKISIRNLLSSKLRSFLTILGIIIGVAAVVVIFAIGRSAQKLIVDQIQGIGSNLIAVIPGDSQEDGPPPIAFGILIKTLTYEDLEALRHKNRISEIESAAGYVIGTKTVTFLKNEATVSVDGVTASYKDVENVEVEKGRFFNRNEERNLSKIAVLGSSVAKDLFGDVNPLGRKIKIKNHKFEVVGVLKPRSAGGFTSSGQDETVFLPLKSAQKLVYGIDHLFVIRMKAKDPALIKPAKQKISQILRQRHDIKDPAKDDFSLRDQASVIGLVTDVTDVIRYFLLVVGSLSLLVGGVGIMNIMLIAVSQRVREVGLRKALGARNIDIASQFLVESVTVSLIGGVAGIILGLLISLIVYLIINALGYDWSFNISFTSIGVGFLISIGVGVIFGMYPAKKASRISPMEALRYE